LGFARAHIVYEGKLPVQLETHLAFPVGTTENDRNVWMHGLDPGGQCEGRDVLFQGGCETDDGILMPLHGGHAMVKEVRRKRANSEDATDLRLAELPGVTKHFLDVTALRRRALAI